MNLEFVIYGNSTMEIAFELVLELLDVVTQYIYSIILLQGVISLIAFFPFHFILAVPTTSSRCPLDSFQCRETFQCIFAVMKCNGNVDCIDGSDEFTTVCNTSKSLLVKLLPPCFYR